MRVVIQTSPGIVELNYMWLPTFVGMNGPLKKEMEGRIAPQLVGLPIEQALEIGHDLVIDFLMERFPTIKGLRDYLDALKYVEDE